MYPYNRNTRLYRTRESEKELHTRGQQNAPLSSDRRLQELLVLAKQDLANTERNYEALQKEPQLAEAKDILHTMQIDEKKHQRILREILFLIFNDLAEDMQETECNTETEALQAEELLEALLFSEMDDIGFYRDLRSAMDTAELRDLFYEIITNKQNHTAALNHLYAKYFGKSSGN